MPTLLWVESNGKHLTKAATKTVPAVECLKIRITHDIKFRSWSVFTISLTALFASLFRLDSVPPLWWDEGWTLSVARNWLEHGHYGRLLAGDFVPPGLQAAPVVTDCVGLRCNAMISAALHSS
jgi:hypothetical protein